MAIADRPRYTAPMTAKKPQLNPLLKLVLDLGPLLLFFLANSRPALFLPLVSPILPADIAPGERVGIFVATAVFMVAVVLALAVSYALTRHLPVMPLVTAVIVLVFGSLTLLLHDELFIKLKPTIIYVLFGAVLLSGLAVDRRVGELQGLRRGPADLLVRRLAISAVDAIRRAGEGARALVSDWRAPARSPASRRCRDCRA